MINFCEWLDLRNEAMLPRDMRTATKFNIGDWVYFGIHDLQRYVNKQKSLPKWEIQEILDKMRPIFDVDPKGGPNESELVWVKSAESPSQLNYKKLESNLKKYQGKIKRQGDMYQIGIPVDWLEDVTSIFGTRGQLSGQKLGLVFDPNTEHQAKLIRKIRSAKEGKLSLINTPDSPDSPSQSDIDAVRAQFGLIGGPSDTPSVASDAPKSLNSLMASLGMPDETPRNTMSNYIRNARQTQTEKPEESPFLKDLFRQTASYDPSVRSYSPYWKNHNDTQYYSYING